MDQYRKSPRADFLDYDDGDFFITVCTAHMAHYFGEIVGGKMIFSPIGEFLDRQLQSADAYCRSVRVLTHVVMPNHIHAVVRVGNMVPGVPVDSLSRTPSLSLRACREQERHVPLLSRYVSSLKGVISKFARSAGITFAWHNRYHDHFIRGSRDGDRIWNYIANNVANWSSDKFSHSDT